MKNKATNKYGIISLWIFDLINENNLPIGLRPKTAPDKKKNNGIWNEYTQKAKSLNDKNKELLYVGDKLAGSM